MSDGRIGRDDGGLPRSAAGSTRIVNVQIMRGAAALAVVMLHARGVLGDHIASWLPDMIVGASGVDVFFVISGFMMVYASQRLFRSRHATSRFLILRITRIVPPYWILSAAYFLYVVVVDDARGNGILLLKELLRSMLFVPAENGALPIVQVGWTLNFEMFFYAIFSLFVGFPRRAAIALVSLTLLAMVLGGASLPDRLSAFGTPIVMEFACGMIIAEAYLAGLRIPNAIAVAMVAFGCISLWLVPLPDENWWWQHGISWGPGSVVIVTALALARREFGDLICRRLSRIGDFSYSLYLTHWILFNVIAHGTQHISSGNSLFGSLLWILLVNAAVFIGSTFHTYIDIPIYRVLGRQGSNIG